MGVSNIWCTFAKVIRKFKEMKTMSNQIMNISSTSRFQGSRRFGKISHAHSFSIHSSMGFFQRHRLLVDRSLAS